MFPRRGSARRKGELLGVSVAGEDLGLHSSGTLWWEAERTLVVADLHFEKGSSFARHGVFLPPYDTAVTLDRLADLVDTFDPARVIALGDSFHDEEGAARMPINQQVQLAMLQLGREWIWMTGNHDPKASNGVFGDHAHTLTIRSLTFRHEPSAELVMGEVAGHLHPFGRIRRHGRSVRRPCFASDGARLVLPAFGSLTGGLNVLDDAWSGLFADDGFTAYLLGDDRLYPIAARKLRGD
nr:ligase-associated DNA damage response endonuclease PdeM [Breoghania sp. L-A4]